MKVTAKIKVRRPKRYSSDISITSAEGLLSEAIAISIEALGHQTAKEQANQLFDSWEKALIEQGIETKQ